MQIGIPHHCEVRWVLECEPYVVDTEQRQLVRPDAVGLCRQFCAEALKTLCCDRCEEAGLVTEVILWRGMGHSNRLGDRTEADCRWPTVRNCVDCRSEKVAPQVARVIGRVDRHRSQPTPFRLTATYLTARLRMTLTI